MGFFNLVISEKEREELYRVLRGSLPESQLDLTEMGYQDEHPLREREEEVVRILLDKIQKAKPQMWYTRLVGQEQ